MASFSLRKYLAFIVLFHFYYFLYTYFLLCVDLERKNPSSFKACSLVTWDSESNSLKTVLTPPWKFKKIYKNEWMSQSTAKDFRDLDLWLLVIIIGWWFSSFNNEIVGENHIYSVHLSFKWEFQHWKAFKIVS